MYLLSPPKRHDVQQQNFALVQNDIQRRFIHISVFLRFSFATSHNLQERQPPIKKWVFLTVSAPLISNTFRSMFWSWHIL